MYESSNTGLGEAGLDEPVGGHIECVGVHIGEGDLGGREDVQGVSEVVAGAYADVQVRGLASV